MKFDTLDNLFKTEYQEEPQTFDINPLVLSVRLKKIKDLDSNRWLRLDDTRVKAEITGDDWFDAQTISDYYSKKLMWTSLKDSKISTYRSHLLSFLKHPKATLTKKEVGMIVTLPYFYQEDQIYDQLVKYYCTKDVPSPNSNMNKIMRELVYLHQTSRWVNKKKFIYYWFADDNKFIYNIQITEDNTLRKFFEDIVLTKPASIFETHITKEVHPFEYYKMFDYRIVK